MKALEDAVLAALATIHDPILQQNYLALNAVDMLHADENGNLRLDIKLGVKSASRESTTLLNLRSKLSNAGFPQADVRLNGEVVPCPDVNLQGHLKQVKNVIMVASGKGGVGKSTTAVNLALALQAEGAQVGLLDADIYGPSQRTMLGVPDGEQPELVDEKYLKPIERLGIKSMSVAYMSAAKTPMVWRGSMAVRALQQLMEQTLWGELDYLIIDMPPGTGDIQISLAQKLAVAGAVIVTTPQEVALADARKGIEMFHKVGIPVLGVVENMSSHKCSHCGHEENIFGSGGAESLAQEYQVPLLGSLPLNALIRQNADAGKPTVAEDPAGHLAQSYFALSHQVAAQIWKQNLTRRPVPQIRIVEN